MKEEAVTDTGTALAPGYGPSGKLSPAPGSDADRRLVGQVRFDERKTYDGEAMDLLFVDVELLWPADKPLTHLPDGMRITLVG
jgi:hypothetical protein